jgi:hypothetical protein
MSSGSLVEVGLTAAKDNAKFSENTRVAVNFALQSKQIRSLFRTPLYKSILLGEFLKNSLN